MRHAIRCASSNWNQQEKEIKQLFSSHRVRFGLDKHYFICYFSYWHIPTMFIGKIIVLCASARDQEDNSLFMEWKRNRKRSNFGCLFSQRELYPLFLFCLIGAALVPLPPSRTLFAAPITWRSVRLFRRPRSCDRWAKTSFRSLLCSSRAERNPPLINGRAIH